MPVRQHAVALGLDSDSRLVVDGAPCGHRGRATVDVRRRDFMPRAILVQPSVGSSDPTATLQNRNRGDSKLLGTGSPEAGAIGSPHKLRNGNDDGKPL